MILPGHLAAGYITAYGLLALHPGTFTQNEYTLLLLWGIVCGDLPDLDVLYSMIRRRSTKPTSLEGHRHYITHAPIVWLVLGLGIYFVSSNPLIQYMGLLVWLGSWSHLMFDTIEHGVRWLWPFSNKYFALITYEDRAPRSPYWKDLFLGYFKVATFYIEVFVVVLAVALWWLS